jgi:hypothetical protein
MTAVHRMEKVDLIPLEWVALSDRPTAWGNGGIMMWCRRCQDQLGEGVTNGDVSLPELVKIADVHQEFYCPNRNGSPDWSWRPCDHPEHQRLRLQFGADLEMIIKERVEEALSAVRMGLRVGA